MEELYRTYKPVRFGWIEALAQSGVGGRRRVSRRSTLRGGAARQRIPGLY